jgi:hypothetical protein
MEKGSSSLPCPAQAACHALQVDERAEYQVYRDPDYRPGRFISDAVAVADIPGQGRGLVVIRPTEQ